MFLGQRKEKEKWAWSGLVGFRIGFGFFRSNKGPVGFSYHKDHLCNFGIYEGLVLTTFHSACKGYSCHM